MIALLDTNVLISAALRDRMPERVILHIATSEDWTWLVSAEIASEYVEVLNHPKFALSDAIREHWLQLVESRTIGLDLPLFPKPAELRDPKDAPFVAALAAQADYLITGDRDLLVARQLIPTTKVVTVAEFCRLFGVA